MILDESEKQTLWMNLRSKLEADLGITMYDLNQLIFNLKHPKGIPLDTQAMALLLERCTNCHRDEAEHAKGDCLFGSTRYKSYIVDRMEKDHAYAYDFLMRKLEKAKP